MADRFPLVSAVMAAYNYGRFLPAALNSALAQDYPADRLEIVIIDDGSTDDTPAIIEEYVRRHPDRIRAYRQANHGLTRTTNEGMKHARGEFIALLDPDDTWLPHKTRAQVERLLEHPEVGLIHGDMSLTDANGNVFEPSLLRKNWGANMPPRGRLYAHLLCGNQATTSSIMVRSVLRSYYDPIPEGQDLISQDWWIAARTAISSEIDYLDEPCATYRIHGSNDFGGATGAWLVRSLRLQIKQARRMLTYIDPRHGLTIAELIKLVREFHLRAIRLLQAAPSPFFEVLAVSDEERARAHELHRASRQSAAAGELLAAGHELVRAYAWDPFNDEIVSALHEVFPDALRSEPPGSASLPPFLTGARRFRTLSFARELIEQPALLHEYGRCFGHQDDATLVIWAPEAELVDPLVRLVGEAGLDGEDQADLLAVSAPLEESDETALARSIHSVLSEQVHHPRFPAPHVHAADIEMLRGIAERRWQRP